MADITRHVDSIESNLEFKTRFRDLIKNRLLEYSKSLDDKKIDKLIDAVILCMHPDAQGNVERATEMQETAFVDENISLEQFVADLVEVAYYSCNLEGL